MSFLCSELIKKRNISLEYIKLTFLFQLNIRNRYALIRKHPTQYSLLHSSSSKEKYHKEQKISQRIETYHKEQKHITRNNTLIQEPFILKNRQLFNSTFHNNKIKKMNTVTSHLKENLAYRHAKNEPSPKVAPASHSSQDKYMHHFETINKVVYPLQQRSLLQSYEDRYQQKMIDYTSKISAIDSILASNEDIIHLGVQTQQMVQTPMIPNLKQSSYDQIKMIRGIFEGRPISQNIQNYCSNLLVVEQYSEILMKIGRRDVALQNKLLAKSKAIIKDPTYRELSFKEIQTDNKQFQSIDRQAQEPFERTKRKDLILMELLRQKKRRGFAQDYFSAMEMKLMQFLDFILEDEEDYMTLQPQNKVKAVLKNLQRFQGKKIEGQSKINLLRIFFEEFTTLKHEKQELDSLKTPVKKSASKQRQGTKSTKYRETSSRVTPQGKQTGTKVSKRELPTQINWIDSEKIDKKKKKASGQKKQVRDQWISSLH